MPTLKESLLFCSGVFPSVLEQINSPQEEEKYAAYGMTVLSTSSLATCSGGYALFAVFGNLLLVIPFALFWGGSILLLDRALLMTMRKQRGKSFKQFLSVFPRLVLALVIGFTVSKPLELRLFKPEIQGYVRAEHLAALRRERAMLTKSRKEAEAETRQALSSASQLSASVISVKKANARTYQQQAAKKSQEVDRLDRQIADTTKTLNISEKSPLDVRLGLLRQIVILEQLGEQQPSVRYTGWLLSMLFVLFEILPVLTKLMSKYSVYDAALEKEDATGIKLQDTMREMDIEQIQRESLARRHYRETLSKAALDELTRASQAQLLQVIRQADAAAQKELHQVEMVEAATDRITDEIKNAIKAPIEVDSAKPSKIGNFSKGFRQMIDRLFWQNT
ncbi:MAG: DUF4407 domain-containing protein [Iphinoe sp. HA4291-MV1]|jgi:hypothetical protein|nr:DUF4407 domain-containing protein [Iphinoe sp. HA4291-MV1]